TLPMAPVTVVCGHGDDCSERVHGRSTVIGVVEERLSVIHAAATLNNPKADDAISRNALALGAALSVRGRAAPTADFDCLPLASASAMGVVRSKGTREPS